MPVFCANSCSKYKTYQGEGKFFLNVKFEQMTQDYGKEVMDIFNYYVENSFAAYPEKTPL
ncbi:hypothetical protein Desgi_0524 [Desulfoscipio gibsoniae DSM 7213]|uniref:Uncharacterized protein n=1 Tax=Desulfoscipio gibsoniae DSM 7213 TaxID=767817 RepID=R4KKD7_9FIRM|nr:hypothetical protein Desgi_0524 [Desulfoscipio gibsoniae DSM 7213]